jgi:methionyl-tRNA synthetase
MRDEVRGVISQDVFRRIELRVGEIPTAEQVPGSDRLLKLTVDLNGERRRIALSSLVRGSVAVRLDH